MMMTMILLATLASAPYAPTWESLDARPVAPWFQDAKFGIFIHWGPYSVPAWSPTGTYSEWYQYWLETKSLFGNGTFRGPEVAEYHAKVYGADFPYYRFGDLFKAELYDPKAWADIFRRSGARYVVLTSKHHDGYCLWPSKQANDRGFPWNSMEVGAKRDLLGELTDAVRSAGLKMGFYYSLYEWFHPWWKSDRQKFVQDHFLPQAKDLVERYKPDILWGDGEWDLEPERWKTPELLAWLFNESPVKDTVVINDRWGKGVRHKHGGYFTTEYESGLDAAHPWEECRGMGFSFGYNRDEDLAAYNGPQTLILLLIDTVSRGGNLLLDIGPDGHGKIPVIMQERLLQMGEWLAINGEAIYGTRPWKTAVQWSEGNRDYGKKKQAYLGGEFIRKQTVDPDPGFAVKEVFFTRKGTTLHAIVPIWPRGKLILKGVSPSAGTQVTLLGTDKALSWSRAGGDLAIDISLPCPPDSLPRHAYAFRITAVE